MSFSYFCALIPSLVPIDPAKVPKNFEKNRIHSFDFFADPDRLALNIVEYVPGSAENIVFFNK